MTSSAELRIAHFSDTHVLSLEGATPREFLNKRATGAVNLAFNRAKQYRVELFEKLLDALVALRPDHTVCTGDLANLALEAEFRRVEEILIARFAPDALTVVPGNHDAYERDATRAARFENHFCAWMPKDLRAGRPGAYPVVRVRPEFAVVGLSTAVPTPAFLATGTVGDTQRAEVARVLSQPELVDKFRLVMLHHPLLPDPSRPLDVMRRLTDAPAVIDTLRTGDPHLIVHGHNHVFLRNRLPGTDVPVIQVASGSRRKAGHMAELNVYRVRDARLVGIERHIYDEVQDRFVAHDEWGRTLS